MSVLKLHFVIYVYSHIHAPHTHTHQKLSFIIFVTANRVINKRICVEKKGRLAKENKNNYI